VLEHAISDFHESEFSVRIVLILIPNPHFQPHHTATVHSVTVALPVLPVTVFLPSTQTGPIPTKLCATVTVSSSQPPQSIFEVRVLGGTVIVHPKGEVDVTVLVQVGDAEQAVIVVVPGRVAGGQI
jgi:hypothetical protein